MSHMVTQVPQLVTWVSCGQPIGVAAAGGQVQLFSGAAKRVEDLQPGEYGVMTSAVTAAFDYDTHCNLQRMSDLALLREGYMEWYKRHGGKQMEQELVEAFNRKIDTKPRLQEYTADRFTNILRQAIELCDEDEDDDDDELLEVCKQVISDDQRLDVDSFVELHRLICHVNGALQEQPTRSALKAAAARQLTHRTFTDSLAQQLPEEL